MRVIIPHGGLRTREEESSGEVIKPSSSHTVGWERELVRASEYFDFESSSHTVGSERGYNQLSAWEEKS